MNRNVLFCFAIFSALLSSSVSAQTVTGFVNDDGFIVISGQLDLIGIDVQSPGGHLIPVPNENVDPFGVLLTNTTNQVIVGSLGDPFALDGEVVLGAGYDGGGVFDLVGTWGGTLDEGPISFASPSVPTIPEPNAGLLASVGLLSLLTLRVRRGNLT